MKSVSQSFKGAAHPAAARNVKSFISSFEWPTLLIGLWVFAGYYFGSRVGFALTFYPQPVSVLWPPNSILAAALLLTPVRVWWFVVLAAFPAHWAAQLQSHVPTLMILSWFFSNVCEALIGAGLARYLVGGPLRFTTLRNVVIFFLCVVFVGPFLSSFLDAAFVRWNQWGESSYWELMRIRLFSNALAALMLVPLIVTWATNGILAIGTAQRARFWEASLLLIGLLSVSFAVLNTFGSGADSALLFLPLSLLIWAAVRFGVLGASTAISIVGFLAIWAAAHGHGPFSGGTTQQNALSIQIFLVVLSIPMLLLATVIEERATRESELRESEARFRVVADAAPVMIWMSDEDQRCTFFNRTWLEFTGRTMEQELGNGWRQGVRAGDLEKCLKMYGSAFDAREPFAIQYRLRHHDGQYRWISDHAVPRYNAQGTFVGYIGACLDVTEVLKREEALREFEQRVTLAAEVARFGVWEMNITTREIWMSDGARRLFRFDPEMSITHEMLQGRIHPDDRARREAAVRQAIEKRSAYGMEYRAAFPDGTVRWIAARARCVKNADGKFNRLIGVSADITQRKEAQELFRLATEAAPSGIILVDREGRIVLVNTHVEELFGYQREELVGKPVEILVPKRFRAIHNPRLRARFLAKPENVVFGAGRELFARRKDGNEFPVEVGLNPIETPNGVLVLATVEDVTARKEAELEAQRHRTEVAHLSRVALMSEMSTSLAHELNQPLSAIVSNAAAGQRFIDRGDVDLAEIREILGDIVSDGRRAGDVVRGIRAMVKKGHAIRQQMNLNDVVAKVVQIVSPDASLRSCGVETALQPNLPPITGDPIQFQQVLLNLVLNAFDAMRDTPVSHRKVTIATEWNGDGTVRASVRDYGAGIPAQARDRIFDPFFTTKKEGLGMGLAIVRSIIESHGGTMAVDNPNDGGARFYFTLPVKVGTQS
jgi:PAS domain S-box-containing protein